MYVPETTVNEPVPVYGAVPPAPVIVITPVPALQTIGDVTVAIACNGFGCEIVIEVFAIHPLVSETV